MGSLEKKLLAQIQITSDQTNKLIGLQVLAIWN